MKLTVLSIASALALGHAAMAEPSLCTGLEEAVFSCAHDGKTISLCVAPAPGGRNHVRYAYGTRAKLDLEITRSAHPEAFSAGVTALSGGGIDYVRVRNGDHAYVVYTGMTPGWSQDGWVVEARGAPVSHHICRQSATGPNVWGPVYTAKLPKADGDHAFHPPEWTGAAPKAAR